MKKLRTHYDSLKITRDAPGSVIKAAYKALAQENHPDRSRHPDAARRMQVVNDAYAVLSDPAKRVGHDKWISVNEKDDAPPSKPKQAPAPEVKKAPASTASQIENLKNTHNWNMHKLRQAHAEDVEALRKRIIFHKKAGVVVGLLLSIPLYLAFLSLDNLVNPQVTQYQTEVPMLRH